MDTEKKKKYKQKKGLDGVIEAAHFDKDGNLAWVRAYERRGPTWSDVVLLDRDALVERLKKRKRFFVGVRQEAWASQFELSLPVRLIEHYRRTVITTGKGSPQQDKLEGIPVV
jgi:hypothetical protein